MRDGATGRSRGFGFLTFKDPKTVNIVMVKEHYLDGKIVRIALLKPPLIRTYILTQTKIDPKRAIPRDEQERTSKIFVGGVSQEATEQDFKQFFMQFGRVVDATLMIDKDTGRPRGFGFVTFDSEAAVDATLSGPLEILGKPIEVKKAQPRGNMRDDDDRRGFRRGGMRDNDRFRNGDRPNGPDAQNQQSVQGQGGVNAGMTPQMMAQYWQRMQQYFAMMQQQMALSANQGQGAVGMGGMNPAMMQQLQQAKQMQQMSPMTGGTPQGGMSPVSQSPGPQGMQGMMNPAMMQQMQQMQQNPQSGAGFNPNQMGGAMGAGMGAGGGGNMGMPGYSGARGGPGYNAQEQLAFEQQKYEQQQARRAMETRNFSYPQQGGQNWDSMYDDVPQQNIPTGPQGGIGRGMSPIQTAHGPKSSPGSKSQTPQPQSAPPANAPTGPRNAGRPGANYRGGGRGAHRGFHPYART